MLLVAGADGDISGAEWDVFLGLMKVRVLAKVLLGLMKVRVLAKVLLTPSI